MTFNDDMVQLEFDGGTRRVTCKALGLDWPPPEFINVSGFEMMRTGMSCITDEERATMTHVIRGAVYEPTPT